MSGPEPDADAGSEPASDDAPAATGRRTTSRFYRRPPGLAWLIGLVLVPLLLAVIGYVMLDRSRWEAGDTAAEGPLPMLIEPTAAGAPPVAPPAGLALAPLTITRAADGVTLTGSLPDPTAKRTLLDAVVTTIGEDTNVFDNVQVVPGIKALDVSAAGLVFEAAAAIPDFTLNVSGDTVSLGGTAGNAAEADAVEDAAEDAWPGLNIVDNIEIKNLENPAPGRP